MFFSLGGGGGFVFASPEKVIFAARVGTFYIILVDLLRLSHVRFASKT